MHRLLARTLTVVLLLFCAQLALTYFGYGIFPWPRPDGLTFHLARDMPYRWPVETWESSSVLGFKVGLFWIGGRQAGRGNFLSRYHYLTVPYWFCVAAALSVIAWTTRRLVRRLWTRSAAGTAGPTGTPPEPDGAECGEEAADAVDRSNVRWLPPRRLRLFIPKYSKDLS
jgi:hypothetical protein